MGEWIVWSYDYLYAENETHIENNLIAQWNAVHSFKGEPSRPASLQRQAAIGKQNTVHDFNWK